MNRTKLGVFQRQALAPKTSELEGAFSAPTSSGGVRFALPEVKTQVVQATLISGDPNHNGGLDANGYQQAFVVTYDFGFTDKSNWPECRLDVSSLPADIPAFDDGTFVYAFMFSFTSDGYLLLKPTVFAGSAVVQLIKTGGASYPSATSGANIFPAHVQNKISYDDTTSTNTLTASDDTECRVLNLLGNYIPSGTYLLGMGISGTTSSGKKHFVVEYAAKTKMIKGHLTAALTIGGSATGAIDLAINCTDSGSVTVYDSNSDFVDATGTKHFMAVYDTTHSKWELIWVAC